MNNLEIDITKLEKVKYYSSVDNEYWSGYIIQKDPDKNKNMALIYFPVLDGFSACYIICKKEENSEFPELDSWIEVNEESWVNC